MVDRYVVTDNGPESTVTDTSSNEIVFSGTYDDSVTKADEFNKQDSDNANQNSAVTVIKVDDDAGIKPKSYTPDGVPIFSESQTNQAVQIGTVSSVFPTSGTTTSGAAGSGVDIVGASKKGFQRPGSRPYNPLSQFSSSAYNINLYMLTPEAFNSFIQSGGKKPDSGIYVIAQSGGLSAQDKLKRVNNLDYDLYIDDLKVTSVMSMKQSNSATNSLGFEFHVYEPYGFSFTTILQQAASKIQAQSKTSSTTDIFDPARQVYLLEVNFTGYGSDGLPKTVTLDNLGSGPKQSNNFNRLWAIKFESFGFKITGKVTQYTIKAVPWSVQTAFGAKYGFVNNPIELKGETVKDILNGKTSAVLGKSGGGFLPNSSQAGAGRGTAQATQISPEPGVNTVGIQNITGLIEAMNNAEKMLVKQGGATVANEYEIEIDDSIAGAKMVSAGEIAKAKSAMNAVSQTIDSNNSASQSANAAQINKRTVSVPAGMSLVQVIDRVIGQSSYVLDCLKVLQKESAEAESDKQDSKLKLQWYNINPIVTIIGDKPDPKRNDYAYKIKYQVTPYQIPFVRSVFLDGKQGYYGPHKMYKYYFTGENTEVLSFEQAFNYLYFTAGPSDLPSNSKDGTPNVPNRQQGGDKGGQFNNAAQGVASLRSNLYNPGDLANATISIIGDPDYLVTSIGLQAKDPFNTFYGDDFAINPNGGQVFIEIVFYEGMDYDHAKGVQMLNNKIYFYPYPRDIKDRIEGVVYNVKYVDSYFSRGKFTQELDLYLWNPGTDNSTLVSEERENDLETQRLLSKSNSRQADVVTAQSESNSQPAGDTTDTNTADATETNNDNNSTTTPTTTGQSVQDDDANAGAVASTQPDNAPEDSNRTEWYG